MDAENSALYKKRESTNGEYPYLVEEDGAGEDKGGLAGGPRAVDPLVFVPLVKSCEPANQSMAVLTPHPVLHSTHKNKKAHSVKFSVPFPDSYTLTYPSLVLLYPSFLVCIALHVLHTESDRVLQNRKGLASLPLLCGMKSMKSVTAWEHPTKTAVEKMGLKVACVVCSLIPRPFS